MIRYAERVSLRVKVQRNAPQLMFATLLTVQYRDADTTTSGRPSPSTSATCGLLAPTSDGCTVDSVKRPPAAPRQLTSREALGSASSRSVRPSESSWERTVSRLPLPSKDGKGSTMSDERGRASLRTSSCS